jgi:hypothetical protein
MGGGVAGCAHPLEKSAAIFRNASICRLSYRSEGRGYASRNGHLADALYPHAGYASFVKHQDGGLTPFFPSVLSYERWMSLRKIGLLIGAVMAVLMLTIVGAAPKQGLSLRPAEATPETTRVKNNRNRAITIKTVGSIYQPYSYEPFRVDFRLGAGNAVTFESGSEANNHVLTKSYIYNNDVGSKEGARVVTKSGNRFVDRCGS